MKVDWYEDGNIVLCKNCCTLSVEVRVTDVSKYYIDEIYDMEEKFHLNKDSEIGETIATLLLCRNCDTEGVIPYNVRKYYSYFSEYAYTKYGFHRK